MRVETSTLDGCLQFWEKRALDVEMFEPETSVYAGCLSLSEPIAILVFERYSNGWGAIADHTARQAH